MTTSEVKDKRREQAYAQTREARRAVQRLQIQRRENIKQIQSLVRVGGLDREVRAVLRPGETAGPATDPVLRTILIALLRVLETTTHLLDMIEDLTGTETIASRPLPEDAQNNGSGHPRD